jgi:hypothetical protein
MKNGELILEVEDYELERDTAAELATLETDKLVQMLKSENPEDRDTAWGAIFLLKTDSLFRAARTRRAIKRRLGK